MLKPDYLGDGVYVTEDDVRGGIVLTTAHHEQLKADNVIFLNPEVLDALDRYLQRMKEGD
jgi:hypothetical protein